MRFGEVRFGAVLAVWSVVSMKPTPWDVTMIGLARCLGDMCHDLEKQGRAMHVVARCTSAWIVGPKLQIACAREPRGKRLLNLVKVAKK